MKKRILAINPGSTSTKIAVFDEEQVVFEVTLRHSKEELAHFDSIIEQEEFRKAMIIAALEDHHIPRDSLSAIVGRGGLLRPISSGAYNIDEEMLRDLRSGQYGQHASNLGGMLAHELASSLGIPSLIVDPVVVDELSDLARLSGLPGYPRTSIFHALNQKAVVRRVAKARNVSIGEMNFIVCHMGGGISIGVHEKGKVVDVNNALIGEGPYSPERAGGLPVQAMLDLCAQKSMSEVKQMIVGQGGLMAYLGTSDGRQVNARILEGDAYARLVYEGMAYQIAKEIGAGATVLKGKIEAIILTGGLAYDELLVGWIKNRISFLGDVVVVAGEDEMVALCEGALRVLLQEEVAKRYGE